VESPAAALFWSETWGPVKRLFLCWLALSLVMMAAVCCVVRVSEPDLTVAVVCTWISVKLLPTLSVFWLGLAGLLLGGGAGAGFRTPLPHYLATLPVSTGTLATQRLIAVLLLWVSVWIPLWLMLALGQYDRLVTRIPIDQAIRQTAVSMTVWMAISAHVAVGALPLVLRGRLAGFPSVFLGSMVCWTGPLLLYLGIKEGGGASLSYAIALTWLAAKIGVAAWALGRSNRAGQITWRFVCGTVGVWLVLATVLLWGLPTWHEGGVWRVVPILLFLPLARPVLCPLALDTNRHR
jgi:hypothetical protein